MWFETRSSRAPYLAAKVAKKTDFLLIFVLNLVHIIFVDMKNLNDRILYPSLEFTHTVDVQSRFSDYDSFRHVNNNAYMAYFDLGKSVFFNDMMGRPCSSDELSAVIVGIKVDFLEPSPLGEPLAVQTAVVNVGERSFTLYQRIVNPRNGAIKAQATSTLAGFDISTQTASELSPALRSALLSVTKQS